MPSEIQTITWQVMGAVLVGAFLHASWNALVKSSTDKALDIAIIHIIGSILALPLVMLVGWPDAETWPFIGASVLIHIGYYFATAQAYKHGDLGLTYPLMRGVAPLLVALFASFSLGETLSQLAWTGMMGVCGGVLLLGLSRQALNAPKAVAFALANAVIIAIYTVVDALGVRKSGNAVQYIATLFLLDGWPFGLFMMAQRGKLAWNYAQRRWPVALAGAVASLGSYSIALWAMTRAPVATVAALRETSVLFAVLLATWVLKEPFTLRRLLGAFIIVGGITSLRLS